METIIRFSRNISHVWLKTSGALLAFMMLLTFQSCQESENNIDMQGPGNLKSAASASEMSIYYGHKIFTRGTGTPYTETVTISNPDYNCYDNFTLFIKNGDTKKTRVSSAEISIDGILIAGPSDFSKNVLVITKPLSGLDPESMLEVKLNSAPGSFIDIWIEGTLNIITPVFNQVGPLALDTQVGPLPKTSLNGITGTWNPTMPNTSVTGFFTFTFTPDEGQCAVPVTMVIEITNISRVVDNQGNRYATVKIGNQWWMSANLKTTSFNNGNPIGTTVKADLDITGESEPKYQWSYSGDEYWSGVYGRLYTWYAITDSRGVCPKGWRIPTETDWTTLIGYLTDNGYGYEGSGTDIAKSMAATTLWNPSDIPGTIGNDMATNNSSGFTAVPGGFRIGDGKFNNAGSQGVWWSSGNGTYKVLWNTSAEIIQSSTNKNAGASVRCIKE
jgi:uncharacterized protein (TIGR02145 family)